MSSSKVSAERAGASQRALLAMFFFQGFMTTTQIPRVPQLIEQINVRFDVWGLIMGFSAVGSIAGLSIANRLIARFGAQRVSQVASLALAALLISFSLIGNPVVFFVANVFWAFAMSCFNISINSQSVILQNALKRVIIGRFHGTWAIGAMLSAAIAGYLTKITTIQIHFAAVAGLCFMAFMVASRFILNKAESHQAERTKDAPKVSFFKTPFKVWLLSFGFFAAVSPELALIDWSAIFSRDAFGIADIALRSIPYTGFMIFMIIGRLSIGRLTRSWHISSLAAVGGLIACAGLTLSVTFATAISATRGATGVVLATACWCLAGLGCATLVPSFFSASGHISGLDTATVMSRMSLIQTVMIIVAKTTIGGIAQGAGIRIAFILPCALLLVSGLIARNFAREAKRTNEPTDAFPATIPVSFVGD